MCTSWPPPPFLGRTCSRSDFSAHDDTTKVAPIALLSTGIRGSWANLVSPSHRLSMYRALAQTDSRVVHVATAPTHGVLPESGQSHVFGLLLEGQAPAFVRCLGVLSATECFAQCRTAFRLDRAPADTADTQERLQIFSPHMRHAMRKLHVRTSSCQRLICHVSVGDEHSLVVPKQPPITSALRLRFR